jgi:hypothetical protein
MRWKEAMRLADQKIQWHPGFYAGIELELRPFDLEYDQEYQLTKGPLSIDLLIIRNRRMQESIMRSVSSSGSIMWWNSSRRKMN